MPKETDQTPLSGYRPILIPPVINKIIECHVNTITETHTQHSAPISERQWGFTSSHSTKSALMKVKDDCSNQGHEVCAVCFDVRKAF